ncbi:MAG: chemotaxis protein CheW [Polyangiales bacterium]
MTDPDARRWLRVRVGDRERELPARSLRAVLASPRVTAVPDATAPLAGLVVWRGAVVELLGDGARPPAAAVVLADGDRVAALAVDAVEGFVDDPHDPVDVPALLVGP